MEQKIVEQLDTINQKFYSDTAEPFSNSRDFYWKGWDTLFEQSLLHSFDEKRISVLDVGCGNGRFGLFLFDKGLDVNYVGWDFSDQLLEEAKIKLKENKVILKKVQLLNIDTDEEGFDLIVLFGVLHHIPGRSNRITLIKKLSSLIRNGGLLVFTIWDFMNDPPISKKLVHWDEVGVDKGKLEEGDFLLDWKRDGFGYRYCHFSDDDEISKLIDASEMEIKSKFMADGKSGELNKYYILQK